MQLSTAYPRQSISQPLSLFFNRAAFALLLLVTAFAPIAVGGVDPWSLLGIRLLVIVGATLWLLSACLQGALALPPRPILFALLAYLTIVTLSTLLSAYTFGSLQTTLNIFVYAAAFLLSCGLLGSQKRRRVFVGVVVATAFVMGVYGALQFFGYQWTPMLTPRRVSSFYYNSNHYSGYLALLVPFSVALLIYTKHIALKLLYALLTALLLFNLALTFSWGLLAVSLTVFGLLTFWAVQSGKVWRFVLATAAASLLGLAGLGALLSFTPQLSDESLTTRTTEFFDVWVTRSFMQRVKIGEAAFKIIRENPMIGVGPGNFIYAFTEHRAPQATDDVSQTLHKFVNYSHNDYTQVASETGLVALVAFLSFWFLVLFTASDKHRRTGLRYGLTAAIVALMLHGISDGNMTVIPANVLLVFTFAGALYSLPISDTDTANIRYRVNVK